MPCTDLACVQELAEVRDVLLEQIAISHTQGLRQTMQHELQSIVSECSKRLPSLSLKSIPSTDQEAETTSDSTHTVSGALSRHGRVAERIVSILHRGEIKKQMAAVFQELLSQQPRGTNSEESKTVFADDNDPGPVFEGESEASSAQELFLEELEEMSQQSGQDLPLEWELTSATVSQAGATTGDFDRDQMGTGSVWEVFDGRCLRQDCLEVRQRYYSLFHWLVNAFSLTMSLGDEGGGNGGGGGHDHLQQHQEGEGFRGCAEGAEAAGNGISCTGCPLFEAALHAGRSHSLDDRCKDKKKPSDFSDCELLGRLITVETQRIGLEQKLSTQLQLFYREREELQQRSDVLQAKCDTLEDSTSELQEKCEVLRKECAELQKCRLSLEEYCRSLEEECQELKICCRLQREELESANYRNLALEDHCDSLPSALFVQKGACSEKEETAKRLHLEKKCEILQEGHGILGEKCSSLREHISEMQEEKEDIVISEKNEKLKQFLEMKIAELEEKCRILEANLKWLDADRSSSESEIPTSADGEKVLDSCGSTDVMLVVDTNIRKLLVLLERWSILERKNIKMSQEKNVFLQKKFHDQQEHCPSIQSVGLREKCNYLEESIRILQERNDCLQVCCEVQAGNLRKLQTSYGQHHHFDAGVMDNGLSLQEENTTLKKKLKLMWERNNTLQETNNTVQSTCEVLEENNRFLKKELDTLQKSNDSLKAECKSLRDSIMLHQDTLNASIASSVSLQEKCDILEKSIRSLQERCAVLEKNVQSLQEKCKLCEEVKAATEHESRSLQQQLRCSEEELKLSKHRIKQLEKQLILISSEKCEENSMGLSEKISKLEQENLSKEMRLAELQGKVTALMETQKNMKASVGNKEELNQLVKYLQNLLAEKDSHILELEEKWKLLMHTHTELRKQSETMQTTIEHVEPATKEKVKIKADLEILSNSSRKQVENDSKGDDLNQLTSIDHQEVILPEEETRRQKVKLSELTGKKMYASSEQSLESSDSMMMSSDFDSDIVAGVDADIMKEMKRLRRDIKRTKAVYANESALLHEALERESMSQSRIRPTRLPAPAPDALNISTSGLPEDPEHLRELVVKLLEENKSHKTENLYLQLRIKEQEALVLKVEEGLSHSPKRLLESQSLFERQLLLLQKQRDELLQQIHERDSNTKLLSEQIGKGNVQELALQHDKETLQEKVEELEHCHQLLQQRQAELAHCQAEKRHLEQLLLLKDETERQLMRQKRLLEEELSSIEEKLQEREAILVEDKARLLSELKKKDLHILRLQSCQLPTPQFHSTPAVFNKVVEYRIGHGSEHMTLPPSHFQHQSKLFHVQHPGAEVSLPPGLQLSPQDCLDGSYLEQTSKNAETSGEALCNPEYFNEGLLSSSVCLPSPRRHSTGESGCPEQLPKDPMELHRFHIDAVERLREKLRLEVEEKACREGQSSPMTGSCQLHSNRLH